MLIFSDYNRYYFTGLNSSAGVLAVTPKKAVLFIDFRYIEKAKQIVNTAEVVLSANVYTQIYEFLKSQNCKQLFLETKTLSLSTFSALNEKLSGINISNESKIQTAIDNMRAVKDLKEIECIKSACALSDETFKYILPRIKIGKTEKEIALEMEFYMRKKGSEGIAFPFIVVSGENSSLPHGVPTDRKLQKGDFVTMDFGAMVNGYCADMTRTVALGQVSQEQKLVYNTVLKAQSMALDKIKAGAVCKDIDAIARDFINKSGFENCFGHGLGHSLGIEIHENPACNTRDTSKLQEGNIMTVEPGIYLENKFGVRIEDTVLVTKDGYENFIKSPKELIIL